MLPLFAKISILSLRAETYIFLSFYYITLKMEPTAKRYSESIQAKGQNEYDNPRQVTVSKELQSTESTRAVDLPLGTASTEW